MLNVCDPRKIKQSFQLLRCPFCCSTMIYNLESSSKGAFLEHLIQPRQLRTSVIFLQFNFMLLTLIILGFTAFTPQTSRFSSEKILSVPASNCQAQYGAVPFLKTCVHITRFNSSAWRFNTRLNVYYYSSNNSS